MFKPALIASAVFLAVTPALAQDSSAPEEATADIQETLDPPTDTETAETAAVDPELIKAGEKVFRKCKACHKVGEKAKNGVGPQLNGIVDRAAATVDGFSYSGAMKKAGEEGVVWNAENLTAYLQSPKGFVKGTKMSFAGLRKEKDVTAIIAYLSTFAE
ncbi:hypothetical protein GCM10008927_03710 [Amylibacter ulvae]|uniref:Cytochrome c domain-containing protein n=1 Tax=Paramylibacter ulvae TaxID=1651968 RepID=A0ABQ3CT04_9RHOB|nr:cytochrome c family protein [Amylibacter ulvae]GHA42482.1 hypothetical protein GCM10008927_03710 [Amylibacter ulvae]